MKKIPLFIIFLIFLFQTGISQTEPRLIKYAYSSSRSILDTFNLDFEYFYDYDIFGNVILEAQKEYNEEGDVIKWKGTFNEYGRNQRLEKKSYKLYNADVDLWITNSWIEYNYNSNNCLVEEVAIKNVGGIYSKTTYEVNENCQWTYKRTDARDMISG